MEIIRAAVKCQVYLNSEGQEDDVNYIKLLDKPYDRFAEHRAEFQRLINELNRLEIKVPFEEIRRISTVLPALSFTGFLFINEFVNK